MKNFMEYNFDIEKIMIICHVLPGTHTPVHKNRGSHGIVFQSEGEAVYTFDNNTSISLQKNEILYLPQGSTYEVKSIGPAECYAINFQLFNTTSFSPFKLKVKNPNLFLTLFQKSTKVWQTKKSAFEIKCKSVLYDIIFEIIKEYETEYMSKSTFELLNPAIEYIHKKYTNENINISALSGLCNISETYFRRIFFKSFGVSPVKYINTLKINRAKELIRSDLYTISEVAIASGFQNESYFSRKFKLETGLSPLAYSTENIKYGRKEH